MSIDFLSLKEQENIHKRILTEKENFLSDLNNIEWSQTGRFDVMFSNNFFSEAVQLVINAIFLYEKGYFDASFYSLRQSIEIVTTSTFFVDDSKENRLKEMDKWIKQERFPQQKQMLDLLDKRKADFAEIKEKMKNFFEEVEGIKQKMNKYVHKQGFDKFYTIESSNFKDTLEQRKIDFENCLKKTIGAIAVYRLTVDPVPIVLLDESIYNRTGQMMSETYSPEFISKYIGDENIEEYKQTSIYQNFYNSIIENEEMLPSVVNLIKTEFIERDKISEILSQKHLLDNHSLMAVHLSMISDKITHIYCNIFTWFFTSVKSLTNDSSYSSESFKIFEKQKTKLNMPYNVVFRSSLILGKEQIYLQHNYPFEQQEIDVLNEIETKLKNH